jgi:hypothetical protein
MDRVYNTRHRVLADVGCSLEFEIFINCKHKDGVSTGVFLELVNWQDFLDAVSQTRLQDEYDNAIRRQYELCRGRRTDRWGPAPQ